MNKYSPYVLYLLISILVAILAINDFGPMQNLQRSLNDLLCSITSSEDARPNIVLVTIDGRSQDEYGQWPWDQEIIGDLTAAVASAEPRAIVLDFELNEDAAQDSAGFTDILAGQLQWIDKSVLTYDIALAAFRSDKTDNPKDLFINSVVVDNPTRLMDETSSLLVRKVFLPAEKLLAHRPYLGFNYRCPDDDRVLRHQPLLANYEGYYYPSVSLLASAVFLNQSPDQIKVIEGKEIQIGTARTVPINDRSEMFINYSKGVPFQRVSAAALLEDGFDMSKLTGKLVMIGIGDEDAEEMYATPVNGRTSAMTIKATIIENIINDNMMSVRDDLAAINLLILLALGGICAFILPRINLVYRLVMLVGCLFLLANANYLLFASYSMIVGSVYLALELVLFIAASPMLDMQVMTGEAAKKAPTAAPKRKAPKKTQAEPEKVPVRELKATASDPENLETRAMTESGKVSPASPSPAMDHQTIDIDTAEQQGSGGFPAASQTPMPSVDVSASGPMSASDSIPQADFITGNNSKPIGQNQFDESGDNVFDSNALAQPGPAGALQNLGRYQVDGVLGKGAMGTVYKGVDPAINRPVALKTIRLDFVTDPKELAELKERLHREAQAAGKLSHPNIVTIYDVGSEGSLQYIAMEFLEGQTIEDLIKKKVRFNYRIIAQMISQICSALEYAHERGIVHRDIKPANIMVLSDYSVKVMDYGIARVDSNSMTKTGIAMGTPNYISPEQLKGLAIDRRADLFSLGVVMYEMLLGRRPFKGENITSLMYAIMNKEPDKPSTVNPQVPLLFDHIIGRALKKDPTARYQKASEVAADLKDFVESFAH